MFHKYIVAMAVALLAVSINAAEAHAWFRFTNKTSKTVYVTFQWHSPGCSDGGSWETRGWWQVAPGATATVFGRDLQSVGSSNYYYYAESSDRTMIWAGPYQTCCPITAFDWCLNTCNNAPETRNLGFREINIGGNNNYTLNLTP